MKTQCNKLVQKGMLEASSKPISGLVESDLWQQQE